MSFVIYRPSVANIYRHSRNIACLHLQRRNKSSEVIKEEYDISKPITFSTSGAGWNYQLPRIDSYKPHPWYKPTILFSTLFFWVFYFMFFRPRNDLDDELEMPLGKRLLLIKEHQLLQEKQRLKNTGNDGKSVDEELKKIHDLRVKYKYI